ncbi:MAG: helix-turn-helix domain-containing protein, partial [Thermoguttaceae bacterium]
MLTEAQRHELVALLAAGHSRRAAARIVGCARSTIYRVEARDPKFAERVARAEGPGENPQKKQDPRKIFPTLHQPANWRAAAWVLERLNPEDFGPPRNASNFDLLVEADIFRSFVELVRDEIPRDTCCLLVRQINQLLAQYDAPSIPQLDEPDPDPVRTDQENEEGGRGQVPAEIARLVATFDGKPFLVDTPEFLADR